MFVRTVTRAFAMQLDAVLRDRGDPRRSSITFGMTDIFTASSTSRPARSIAAARLKGSWMFALSAEISALTTRATLPPAR